MKIFNKTLATVAVVAVSSILAPKASAQDFDNDDFDMYPTTSVCASIPGRVGYITYRTDDGDKDGWKEALENEELKAKNKDQIEAIKKEVQEIRKTRRLNCNDISYYAPKLKSLGCGLVSAYMILLG